MAKFETLEEFITKSRLKHGDKYDYSKVELSGNGVKVKIICKIHGEFSITPGHHKSGKGCRKCATVKNSEACRELWKDYEQHVMEVHSGKYTYEQPEDKYRPLRVNVICPEHGVFNISASSHKTGRGCRKCGIESTKLKRRGTLEQFVKRAKEVHGDKYDYSQVVFVNDTTKVDILCKKHGLFSVMPSSHKSGCGCKKCADEESSIRQRGTLEDFLTRAKQVHGDRYCYDKIKEFPGDFVKVEIVCKEHGSFWQTPSAHKVGKNCVKCQPAGYDQQNAGRFYILTCGNITKVGITNKLAETRALQISKSSGLDFKVHSDIYSEDGARAHHIEKLTKKWLRASYSGVDRKFDGYSECFVEVPIEDLLAFVELI